MAESLQKLVESLQTEIKTLREQVNSGRPTVPNDLSLICLIPKWSGTETSISVDEYFELVESTAKIGNWSDSDRKQITVLKLTDVARAFYSSNRDLRSTTITWEDFKLKFLDRFRDVRSDQYHFTKLQRARQLKDETPQIFLDRCRSLAMKTAPKVEDAQLQKFHSNQAQRMLLSTFIAGLSGNPGQSVRFQRPQTFEPALQIAVTVYEAEAQEKRDATFFSTSETYRKGKGNFGQPWKNSGRAE